MEDIVPIGPTPAPAMPTPPPPARPQPPMPRITPPPPHHEKHHLALFDLLIVAIVAVLVGTGAYFFFSWQVSQTRTALQQQLTSTEQQKTTLMNQLQDQNLAMTKLQADKKAAEDKLLTAGGFNYDGWQTYMPGFDGQQFAFTFRYPADWKVKEATTLPAKSASGKYNYCANFYISEVSSREGSLVVCFRSVTDQAASSWMLGAITDPPVAKAGLNLLFGNKTITEKTFFGSNRDWSTIIYAQNIADDETGFPARIKIGDYYFSAVATGKNVPTDQQLIFDQILASLQLPAVVPAE